MADALPQKKTVTSEKKKKIITETDKIIKECKEVLMGLKSPIDINIAEKTEKLAEIRPLVKDEDDIARGSVTFHILDQVHTKQGDFLKKIAGDRFRPSLKKSLADIRELLGNSERLQKFRSRLWALTVGRELISFPAESFPIKIPVAVAPEWLGIREISAGLKKIAEKIDLKSALKSRNLRKSEEEVNRFKRETVPIIEDEEAADVYDEIMEILEQIREKDEIFIAEFLLEADTYADAVKRLQALGYLVSHGYLELIPAGSSERERSGRFKAVSVSPRGTHDSGEEGTSFILGLFYNEWKKAKEYISERGFEGRPILSNID